MNFSNWHDFLYMGGHYLYVWSAYGVGVTGIAIVLARPLRARRRFFAEQTRRQRRSERDSEDQHASHPA